MLASMEACLRIAFGHLQVLMRCAYPAGNGGLNMLCKRDTGFVLPADEREATDTLQA
jgi:hypothetical protein